MQVKDVCCGGSGRGEGTEVGMVEWCLVEDPENKVVMEIKTDNL